MQAWERPASALLLAARVVFLKPRSEQVTLLLWTLQGSPLFLGEGPETLARTTGPHMAWAHIHQPIPHRCPPPAPSLPGLLAATVAGCAPHRRPFARAVPSAWDSLPFTPFP